MGTLVCRRSLFAMLVKLDGSTALDPLNGFTVAFLALPPEIRQTGPTTTARRSRRTRSWPKTKA